MGGGAPSSLVLEPEENIEVLPYFPHALHCTDKYRRLVVGTLGTLPLSLLSLEQALERLRILLPLYATHSGQVGALEALGMLGALSSLVQKPEENIEVLPYFPHALRMVPTTDR